MERGEGRITVFQEDYCVCPSTSHINSGTREGHTGRTCTMVVFREEAELSVTVTPPREQPPVLEDRRGGKSPARYFFDFFFGIRFRGLFWWKRNAAWGFDFRRIGEGELIFGVLSTAKEMVVGSEEESVKLARSHRSESNIFLWVRVFGSFERELKCM
jgi:hypothetical protein